MALRWLCVLLLALPGAAGDCLQPPRFQFAEPVSELQPSYPVGTVLRYRCRPGYVRNGGETPDITCLENSSWSKKSAFCIGKSCGQPDIENGNFHTDTDLLFGATVTFTCHPGYQLVGSPYAECTLKNNQVAWSTIPICQIILCPPPPKIENGQLLGENDAFSFGMSVSYRCNKGLSLIGDDTIYCTVAHGSQGVWSSPAPECKEVKCENPQVPNGRRLSGFGSKHTYRDQVTFECNTGYSMKGSRVITCGANSTWTPPVPTCTQILCGRPPQFPFATPMTAVKDKSEFGTEVTYHCNPGYTAAPGKSSVITCQSNETWSAADPNFCVRQQCSAPKVEHGAVVGDVKEFPYETVVTFTCNAPYTLKQNSAKCVVAGDGVDWDPAPPYCSAAHTIIVGIFPLLLAVLVMNI